MNGQCDCADWEPQTEKINGPIILQQIRAGHAIDYGFKAWLYCPWCGKQIIAAPSAASEEGTAP